MFICECGQEFEKANSFNGHKSHCKVHQLAKYGTLDKLASVEASRKQNSATTSQLKQTLLNFDKKLQWSSEEHKCEHCGKVMTEKYGSGRFCCRACANSRSLSEAKKQKIANTLKNKGTHNVICENCGNLFTTKDYSRKQCYICLPKTIKHNSTGKDPKTILELSSRTISKILLRLNLPCTCCNFYVSGIVLDLHHITPKASGGSDDASNLTYICPNCHRIAHTDISLLPNKLISFKDYLAQHNLDWKDYYYG